jgi:hypothetical protein
MRQSLPQYVETLGNVPKKLLPLYESAGDGFALNPAGKALARYRKARAGDPAREPMQYKDPLTRLQWQMLVGLAEPGPERAHFLKCAATRRIRIAE